MACVAVSKFGLAAFVGRGLKCLWGKSKPLAITAVVVFSAIKINNYIKKQNRRKKWNNAGKDVVVLHMFNRGKYYPNLSPFAVKLEMYLRMADIPYQIDFEEPLGPKGKCPWITLNGEDIADSQLVIERLGAKFDKDFSSHLTAEQHAVAQAMRVMVDEHLSWIVGYWRYVTERGMPLISSMELKFHERMIFRHYMKRIKHMMWVQGIGRHATLEIEEMGRKDLHALSVYLEEKQYLMGDEPSEVDCAVFGRLSQLVWNSPNSPYLNMINNEFPNLHQYCRRVKERFWPDWGKCLHPPQ